MITEVEDEEDYDLTELSFGDHDGTREWLLLQSYVNTKIARLFRAMVNTEMLGEKVDYTILYRDTTYVIQSNKSKLENLGKAIGDYVFPNRVIGGVETQGQTRRQYFEVIQRAISFTVVTRDSFAKHCKSMDDLVASLTEFNCIELFIKNEGYGYCAEQIVCLLLDYCFSAVKYSINWARKNLSPLWRDSGGKYRYLSVKDEEEKCQVLIRRLPGGDFHNIKYDYLTLENQKVAEPQQYGMSVLSTKWYIETLWKQIAKTDEINDCLYPQALIEEGNKDRFVLKLPILRS